MLAGPADSDKILVLSAQHTTSFCRCQRSLATLCAPLQLYCFKVLFECCPSHHLWLSLFVDLSTCLLAFLLVNVVYHPGANFSLLVPICMWTASALAFLDMKRKPACVKALERWLLSSGWTIHLEK